MIYTTSIILIKLKSILREFKWWLLRQGRYCGDLRIHSTAYVHWTTALQLFGGSVSIAEDAFIDRGVGLHAHGGNIVIGRRTTLNSHTLVIGGGDVMIGCNVLIAGQCTIVASNHNFGSASIAIRDQGVSGENVVIEDDVWLGTGVRVLAGVRVGRGAIVGAGSVVTRDIEPMTIVAGVPARVIGTRG